MFSEPKLCVCGKAPQLQVEPHSTGHYAPAPRARYACVDGDHVVCGPWVKGHVGQEHSDPRLINECLLTWNKFAAWTSFGSARELGAVTEVILTEARDRGADSPVDYGDAEQIAKAVILQLLPEVNCTPLAYLKQWFVPADPVPRIRVDLKPTHEVWLDGYNPKVTPLGAILSPDVPSSEKVLPSWECFLDTAYFDMWCVRQVGVRTFGNGFHLTSGDEAKGLCDLLNGIDRILGSTATKVRGVEKITA